MLLHFQLINKGKCTLVAVKMKTRQKYSILHLSLIKNKIKCRNFLSKINNKTLPMEFGVLSISSLSPNIPTLNICFLETSQFIAK